MRVSAPTTYSPAQLAALPQVTYAVTDGGRKVTGGRLLLLSLVQDGASLALPRLVPDGDFYGDRLDNGIVDLYAGTGPAS